jgi:hypothetical protein
MGMAARQSRSPSKSFKAREGSIATFRAFVPAGAPRKLRRRPVNHLDEHGSSGPIQFDIEDRPMATDLS